MANGIRIALVVTILYVGSNLGWSIVKAAKVVADQQAVTICELSQPDPSSCPR
jgi:hypothetical protein